MFRKSATPNFDKMANSLHQIGRILNDIALAFYYKYFDNQHWRFGSEY